MSMSDRSKERMAFQLGMIHRITERREYWDDRTFEKLELNEKMF